MVVAPAVEAQQAGFRNRRSYLLEWDADSPYHGLQVRTRPASLGAMVNLETRRGEDLSLLEVFRPLAEHLVWWNLEDDDGNPVPPTLEGMLTQDSEMVGNIMRAWQRAVVGVSDPKEPKSSGGSPSPEVSIPMDIPSESQAI